MSVGLWIRATSKSAARKSYWLTPRVWNKRCSHCGVGQAVAVRVRDNKYACEGCVARLGIRARESKAWRDGGSRAGAAVTVRHTSKVGG
jgi:hypothetical protein